MLGDALFLSGDWSPYFKKWGLCGDKIAIKAKKASNEKPLKALLL
jgi:hypothetical protein